ncbi:hypothetical protein RND71_041196 [Anisodus tanguticus]|uniref:TRF2/HOY1 PH-like domain-containing protein n=1 Tax=Anisodus tanguticus TaxID=243964 RepID=A0AAE1QTN5_9SOLA|nr:hypothetical protein RND71_041196 [Anisodus tanguticus]
MVIRDDYGGLYGLDHQNVESTNPQINDHDNEHMNTSLRLKSRSTSSDSDEDGRYKRFRPSPESNSEDGEMNNPNLLGLTLKKTPSFMNLIETQLSAQGISSSSPPRRVERPTTSSRHENQMNSSRINASKNKSKTEDFAIASEKLKASNFPAMKLKIGTWERVSRHEGDLIAKCYYAKRKLVWEILDGPLKSKIEIQWSDIIAIRASIPPGEQPGVLELELNQPPTFYRETNPQPRKHTLWQQTSDFTGGQAPIYRRHCVRFSPGVLDKHYEKLLNYDARLKELSKQPFPQQLSPYFESDTPEFSNFSFDNNYGSQIFPRMHHPFCYSSSSSIVLPNHPVHNKSTMMPPMGHFSSSFPVSGGRRNNYAHTNQRTVLWGQGPNNLVNVAMGNQTIGMLPDSTTPQTNWVITTQNYQAMYPQNDSMGNNQENVALNYIKNHLLNDNQVASSNEPTLVANVDSMYSLLEHHENGTLDVTGDVYGLNFGYQVMDNYAKDVVPNNVTTYAEPITWMVSQEANQNLNLEQTMEHFVSPSTYANTIQGGYPTLDANQDV